MNSVVVDFDACTGCKTCYLACFADVIRWDAEARRPVVAYPEDCVRCNVCELNCKDDAITVAADWDMDFPPVIERGFPYTVGGTR
jgi:NAD-dependent dihydropyrimidine dehydrogenase PreA subunit